MEFKQELFQKSPDIDVLDKEFSMYNYGDAELSNFKVEDSGEISIKGERNFKYTSSFVDSFCNLLTIPHSFGRKIPIDLLQFNVDRLKNETKINANVKYVFREDTLVNILKVGKNSFFKALKPSEVILPFLDKDKYKIENCLIGDPGLVVDVTHKDLGDLEATKVGDIISMGYRFSNPFTMFGTNFTAGLYLKQLVCSNGMIANKLMKSYSKPSINLRNNLGDDHMYMEAMEKSLRQSIAKSFDLGSMGSTIKGMLTTEIDYRHLNSILNKCAAYEPSFINNVFKIDWAETKKVFEDNYRNKENDSSNYKYFDVMFNMTQECQKLDLKSKLQIEEYSDTIISLYNHQISLN